MRGYYFITDAGLSRAGNEADVRLAEKAGAPFVQYRSKEGTTAARFVEAKALRALCRRSKFVVNDRVDIALAVGADGVHLGQDDLPLAVARQILGPEKILGLTVHSVAEALAGAADGADYLGVSPIFATTTKPDAGRPAGLDLLRQIRRQISLPLVAIGGITLENAPAVIAASADMVCAISAVVARSDVEEQIDKFSRLFK